MGLALGSGNWEAFTIACVWLWMSERYQWFGFAKYQDSIKRDWRDYMVLPIGVGIALLYRVLG